jgi:iron complex outermembrane receptor protein
MLVKVWPLFVALLVSSAWAADQSESGAADASGGQSPPKAQADASGSLATDLLKLDIEQLAQVPVKVASAPAMDLPVTSVTKELSTVGRSAAAVFVITPEMIRRCGATCIPEALRLSPGLDVAQINSNTWAISCRGFNSAYSNKLLVLIDGRTVYNPDFSGVYWNMQDVLLEDVERIEVIRGPGGTLWGSNAVNGVINVITKKAADTQGIYASAGGGSQKQALDAGRYGGKIGDDIHYRVYAKHFEQGPGFDPTGLVDDSWRQGRFGFRADWVPDRDDRDTVTLQGDHFVGSTGNSVIPTNPALPDQQNGENLLMRWRHVDDEDSDWALQAYYDNFMRNDVLQTEQVRTFDVDFQYRFPLTQRQHVTCGAGFRNVESYFAGGDTFTLWYPNPYPYFTTNYGSQFIQDEVALVEDRLTFTIGTKLEENPYTGLEYQPSARFLLAPDNRHSAWTAVSRAIRAPSRYQEQATITLVPVAPNVYPRFIGGRIVSETEFAYEMGYREQMTDQLSFDIATFYNTYDHLSCTVTGTPFPEAQFTRLIVPLLSNSGPSGETYGVEVACNYSVSDRWRLYTQYSYLQLHVHPNPGQELENGNDPCNQVYFRSAWDLRDDVEFDLMARYVDDLPTLNVPSYITMDARLAWRPRKQLEVAVVGQNLLQAYHYEFAGNSEKSPTYATEVPRGVYGTLTWRR